ncbi:hypothetical protein OH77DRAFT_1470713 [Trametes cingulata]|nr:hypothetical protein OH77DRAFT_1470713 [Trametes cingulata]
MEFLQARRDSFQPFKSKRTKASSSRQASASSSKWPHPPTWKATPNSLAEAGFYYNPGPNEADNVTCFMCKKNLCGWEPEDDPFEIHYEKCSDVCAWAVVRCQKPRADGSYDFSDPTRHPTSKSMEKARLDTFLRTQWPHDSVKGHGASSKALAKAGFVSNASEPGDDTAICLYCNLSLGGWDEEDDPYEEHMKRDKKYNTGCAFLKAYAGASLGKSTSKRPPSKAASKPPSRSASQTIRHRDAETAEEGSDDELAGAPSSGTIPSKGPRASKSRSSRASSAPAKTPASRRSTRGTSTSGKTPGSRNTASSDVDETDAGSGSETGKRVSKSKRKTGGRTKARVSAIAEEDGEEEAAQSKRPDEDVEMQEVEEPQEPVKEKRKRGRPPKNAAAPAAAKPVAKPKSKKVVEPEETEGAVDTDTEPAPPPPVKKTHARTRSKANLESESEAPAPAASKPTHTRTKSGSKAKVKQEEEDEPAPAAGPKRKGKQKAAPAPVEEDEEEEDVPPPPPKAKAKASAGSRSKVKAEPEEVEEDVAPLEEPEPPRERTQSNRSTSSRAPKAPPSRRTPSLSDDAGYATAEAPADPDRMDVDAEEPPAHAPSSQSQPRKATVNGAKAPLQRTASISTPQTTDGGAPKRPSPALNGVPRGSSVPSSRASSTRPLGRVPSISVNKDSLKIIEIDSDGEEAAPQERSGKSKAVEQTAPVNGVKKPPSKPPSKKLQVEVVLKSKPPSRQPGSEDVPMQEPSPTSPARKEVARSPSPARAVRNPEPPGTPVSAVHRSAQVSPARPIHEDAGHADGDVAMPDTDAAPVASSSPRTYHPVLAQIPIEKLTSLTEEEANMTLEEYIRRETELQYAQFKADAERRIEEFKRKAAEARRIIETS